MMGFVCETESPFRTRDPPPSSHWSQIHNPLALATQVLSYRYAIPHRLVSLAYSSISYYMNQDFPFVV